MWISKTSDGPMNSIEIGCEMHEMHGYEWNSGL